jgi:hypothetical protein
MNTACRHRFVRASCDAGEEAEGGGDEEGFMMGWVRGLLQLRQQLIRARDDLRRSLASRQLDLARHVS